jgi:hypothetical protein
VTGVPVDGGGEEGATPGGDGVTGVPVDGGGEEGATSGGDGEIGVTVTGGGKEGDTAGGDGGEGDTPGGDGEIGDTAGGCGEIGDTTGDGEGKEGSKGLHLNDLQSTGLDKTGAHSPGDLCNGLAGKQFLLSSTAGKAEQAAGSPVKKLSENVKFLRLGNIQILAGI